MPRRGETHRTAIDIPIDHLIVAEPRKLRPNRAMLRKKFAEVHDAGCGCCLATAAASLHTTWAKRKAIANYEKFMNFQYDLNLGWATHIDTVAATSLGIEGWALYDVGTLEDDRSSSSMSSTSWAQQAHGIFERSGKGGRVLPDFLNVCRKDILRKKKTEQHEKTTETYVPTNTETGK